MCMGLLDGLFRKSKNQSAASGSSSEAKTSEEFFLDADASTSLGDLNYMRRSNTIRHTFPGTPDNPGTKEMVQEVDSMQAKLDKVSKGLPVSKPDPSAPAASRIANSRVPKKVKKTFASPLSQEQLQQRLKGSAVKPSSSSDAAPATASENEAAAPAEKKPGFIDPFLNMARDLNF